MTEDPWKVFMTTDHPNAGPFTDYPKILAWLVSKKAREATFKRLHKKAQRRSLLPSISRELSLYDLAIVTRAGQAKSLGLKEKGHLGVGADADVAIFNLNPEEVDIASKYKTFRRAFSNAAYTIKAGKVLVKDGEILQQANGKTIWLDLQTSREIEISDEIKRKFRQYWTIEYENYPVSDHYVKHSSPMIIKADV